MLCPCGTNKEYEQCCLPFHKGRLADDALLLMRSRYSAYVLNIPEYIMKTTHPASPQYSENTSSWKKSISHFSKDSTFHSLEILDFKEREAQAIVTFTVHVSQKGKDATFTERSHFEKRNGRWLYRGGQLAEGHAPNLITTGQLRILPLAYYGDPILRQKAEPVSEITDDLKKLVEEMIETMDAFDGMGLAATQVHHKVRVFILRIPIEEDGKRIALGDVEVFINPVLISLGEETWTVPEGCLSIPFLRAAVERSKEVTVEYTDLSGRRVRRTFTGWAAKGVLHENDHLNGVLFIDRLSSKEQKQLAPFLEQLEKRIHDGEAL